MMKKLILVSAVSLSIAGLVFLSRHSIAESLPLGLPVKAAPTLKLGEPLPANLFVELAKAINPSVVNISTSALARRGGEDPMRDMLEKFYGIPQDP